MSSSESESEDENLKKIAEAVDNSFYSPDEEKKEKVKPLKEELPKSQRIIDEEENIFKSELNVSESMKNFIGKKMSSLIEQEVEFVEVKPKKIKNDQEDCIKLLKGCKKPIKLEDPVDEIVRVKMPIKRRKVEELEIKESSKIDLAATDISKIQEELSHHENKIRHPTYKFKTASDGKAYVQEPPNDFTKSRKKNNWNYSMIKNAKNFGKSLNKIL